MYYGKSEIPPKRAPKGAYDPDLLCGNCEKQFDLYDNYAADVLLEKKLDRFPINDEIGNPLGYVIPGINYEKIKLFFLSTLWRSAESRHEMYKGVRLGPFLPSLKSMILTQNPGSWDNFSIIVGETKFPGDNPIMIQPYRARLMGGVNFYSFYIGRYNVLIKVDKRQIDQDLTVLQPKVPWHIPYLPLAGSPDGKIVEAIVKSNSTWISKGKSRN